MKLLLLLLGVAVAAVITDTRLPFPGGWLERWNRWDAPHYIDVARDGYRTTNDWIVFYPLYPWLMRGVNFILHDAVASAHLVSLIAAMVAALLMQRLTAIDFDRDTARLAALYMFVFPTAYFFHVGYTESLFIALMLGCVLAAREEKWGWAAVAGALASLTRVNGLLLVPVMAAEAFVRYREGRRFDRKWLFIPLAATGFFIYLGINYAVWGNALHFTVAQRAHWGKWLAWPWVGIARALLFRSQLNPARAHLGGTEELLFIALGLIATVAAWKKLRASYAVWMTLNWLLIASTNVLQSTPRYLLSFFPMFILFALLAKRNHVAGAVMATASVMFLAIFAAFFSLGIWAF